MGNKRRPKGSPERPSLSCRVDQPVAETVLRLAAARGLTRGEWLTQLVADAVQADKATKVSV